VAESVDAVGGRRRRTTGRSTAPGRVLAALLLVAVLVVAVGGFGFGWAWTGFRGNRDLWDILHLLVLPLSLTIVPFWYRRTGSLHPAWLLVLAALSVAFVLTVVGGYWLGWAWTGYPGNTLWDWLELLILPVTITLLPIWLETHERLEREWLAGALVFLGVIAVLAVGGYAFDWTWTGFPGNTLWDWLELCLVPFAVPAVVTWVSARDRRQRRLS
jgi:heme/copper-type cytochrome/quinol oxidase subunit 4